MKHVHNYFGQEKRYAKKTIVKMTTDFKKKIIMNLKNYDIVEFETDW